MIVEAAPGLRQAGVTEIQLEGLAVKLAPHVDESVVAHQQAPAPAPLSLLDDPESYGLPPGSPVPGFAALRDKREKGESS